MTKIPAIVPITDLRHDAASVLKRVQRSQGPVVITQRGRATAVMVSIEDYENAQTQREILYMLARGDKEVSAAMGHDLDDVMAEARALLDEV